MRGVTLAVMAADAADKFQPTRPVRGVTLNHGKYYQDIKVSTHTPRAGRDCIMTNNVKKISSFNPHAPCGA